MIDRQAMMPLLLTACPSFRPAWDEFLADYSEYYPDDLPLYAALGDFARHLIGLLERREEAPLRAALAAIERLHTDGDEYVQTAAIAGILEQLDNWNQHRTTRPKDFLPFLGPESRRWWEEYGDFEDSRPPDE